MDNLDLKNALQESYNKRATERDQSSKDIWKVTEREVFLSYIQGHACKTLLEIGAGTGQDSLFFEKNGLKTISTDISREMVRLCRDKNLTTYQMDFYNLDFPSASFDAIWSFNCLLHVPKRDLQSVLSGIRDIMKLGGLFYMGLYGGENFEGIWQRDTYEPKRFFSFHTDESMMEAVSQCFDILYFKDVDYGNESLHFQSMILQKN